MVVNGVLIKEIRRVNDIEITQTHANLLNKIENVGEGFVWQQSGVFKPSVDDVYKLGNYGSCKACSKIPSSYFVDLVNADLLNYFKHDYPNNILEINRKWKSVIGLEDI